MRSSITIEQSEDYKHIFNLFEKLIYGDESKLEKDIAGLTLFLIDGVFNSGSKIAREIIEKNYKEDDLSGMELNIFLATGMRAACDITIENLLEKLSEKGKK
jgi:hypothetical protein